MSDEGKLPPFDEYAEKAALGSMLMGVSPDEVFDLTVDHFYADSNRRTFEAILAVHGRGDTVDYVSVGSELKNTGRASQVDTAYVRSLTADMAVVSPQKAPRIRANGTQPLDSSRSPPFWAEVRRAVLPRRKGPRRVRRRAV